jgi:hypothetical protein
VLELGLFKARWRRAYCIKMEERKYDSCGGEYTPNAGRKTNIIKQGPEGAAEPGGSPQVFEGAEAPFC